jgi:hypothetical protein
MQGLSDNVANKDDWRTVNVFVAWNDVVERERCLFLKKECNIVTAVTRI